MILTRKSGILLHPTSLPSTPGIGTVGKPAFDFVDFLSSSNTRLWQVLPLGPTGYGDSPYQSFSTFALNPLLIDLSSLAERGWADEKDIMPPAYIHSEGNVDFGSVVWWKTAALKEISLKAHRLGGKRFKSGFEKFCAENSFWLDDFAAFMSIKSHYDSKGVWNKAWPESLRAHDKDAVEEWVSGHKDEILSTKVIQFFIFTQWKELHEYALSRDVEIIGDIPIFVSPDSSDVWANQKYFKLDADGLPSSVAGVPPDYFSPTGQLWGNPLYDWKALAQDSYNWWVMRVKQMLSLVDYVRIDHFRGFDTYWSVKRDEKTAEKGRWLKGPGDRLFKEIKKELGDLPLIAEDLGEITDSVRKLRDRTGLPGMKILQFGFDTAEEDRGALVNSFLPHTYIDTNCVAYTGTHDNDTTQGSLNAMGDRCLCLVASYVQGRQVDLNEAIQMRSSGELSRKLVSLCFSSVASFAIVPMQDLYGFGSDCRMNTPSKAGGNWAWRMREDMLYGALADEKSAWLKEMNCLYNR